MWDGVAVDPMTESFLALANDPRQTEQLYQSLRSFFHDARNRLGLIKSGLYLAQQAATADQLKLWDELDLHYQTVERFVERVQGLFQPASFEPYEGDLGAWLNERRLNWESWFGARDRRFSWCPPAQVARGWFDPTRLLQALDALMNWRAGVDGHDEAGRLAWSSDDTHLQLDWIETHAHPSGQVEARDARAISMALPLLAQVMSAHGGTLAVANTGGFAIGLRWPIRPDSTGPT